MKYILKIHFLRNILIISSLIAIGLPLYVFLFIYPSFHGMITTNMEDEAIRVARHLMFITIQDQPLPNKGSLPDDLLNKIQGIKKDFNLMKLKIFSDSGETIYSTTPKDIGVINKGKYFHEIVAKGKVYTKFVEKGTKSLEDQIVTSDVVETYVPIKTYVPIIKNDAFIGAFEIYYDIRDRKERLDQLLLTSSVVLILLAISLQGAIVFVLVKAGHNIIQRGQAEEALRESGATVRSILRAAPTGIGMVRDRVITRANERLCEILGYSREELLGKSARVLYPTDEDFEYVGNDKYVQICNKETETVETRWQRKDGKVIDVLLSSTPIDPIDLSIGVTFTALDITERKHAEEALKERELQYRSLFENTGTATFVTEEDMTISQVNSKGEELTGYSRDEIEGKMKTADFIPVEELERIKKYHIGRRKKDGDIPSEYELDFVDKKGNIKNALIQVSMIPGTKQSVASIIDITSRKRAEEALKDSEEKYRLLFENANDAIFVAQDQSIKFSNPKTSEIIEYSEEELLKISFFDIIHPEDREAVIDRHIRRLSGEQGLPATYSFKIFNKAGDDILIELSAVMITWEGRPATLNFARDITQQKKLEDQLQQAQRMESLGTLAGGIAHDFNNLLMGIRGRTSLMLMDSVDSHSHFEHLKEIEGYIKSAAELTKQLLGFARGGKYEVKTTDLNEFIKKQNRMFGRTIKEITIRGRYEKNLWTTDVDQGQIEQVLLNLYVNSWQAMPGGGGLYIQTENIVIDESFNRPYQVEPGKYVKISVTDTGVGMDETTQQRIFDPFFTTKEMGRGTGLGLASAYGIIKNHKGFIDVYSEKGEGTTFNIYLPASEKEVVKEKKSQGKVLKGAETTLLVDDEDIILDVGPGIIEKLGYKVLTAKSGKEAIEIYKKNHDRIDIVILDMIMPEMGGGDTYDKLKEINPDIKVLLSSGYSINGQATEILERGCNGFIQKPFYMIDLSQKLREILGEK